MTWFVKAKKPDGKIVSIVCDDPNRSKTKVEGHEFLGLEVWIEDKDGARIDAIASAPQER